MNQRNYISCKSQCKFYGKNVLKFWIKINVNVSANIRKGKCVQKRLCLNSCKCACWTGKFSDSITNNSVICILIKTVLTKGIPTNFNEKTQKKQWSTERIFFIFYLLFY